MTEPFDLEMHPESQLPSQEGLEHLSGELPLETLLSRLDSVPPPSSEANPASHSTLDTLPESSASLEHDTSAPDSATDNPEESSEISFEPKSESIRQPDAALRLKLAVLTDIGCVRTNNEDSFGYDQALGLYVVCDGMGGMASGEIASALAVSTLIANFAESAGSDLPVSTRLLEAITAANRAVWQYGQQPEHRGMGTTLVAAAVEGQSLIVGNVGDSRAYMLHEGQCMQLTVDHSYLNELIRNGTLTLENAHLADLNGMESVITRAIGAAAEVQPDFFSIQPSPGDQFLLASDGLTRYLKQEEILQILFGTDLEEAPSALIEIAKARGGVDNITCLLLHAA